MPAKQTTYIKIAGMRVPIHLAWKKVQVLQEAANILEGLNENHPQLATEFTQDILPIVRHRLDNAIGQFEPPPEMNDDFIEFLKQKITTHEPEQCLEMLEKEKGVKINLFDLVYFVGTPLYLEAMQREAKLFYDNKIDPNQTADLWNDMGRPAPGKDHWVTKDVEKLLGFNSW